MSYSEFSVYIFTCAGVIFFIVGLISNYIHGTLKTALIWVCVIAGMTAALALAAVIPAIIMEKHDEHLQAVLPLAHPS